MSVETQLANLKEEIVALHREITGNEGVVPEDLTTALQQKMLEYETASESYNELFKEIMEETVKMKDGYADARRQCTK